MAKNMTFPSNRLTLSWLLCIATLLSGCNPHDANMSSAQNQSVAVAKKPSHPNYLRIPFSGDVSTVDPAFAYELNQIEIVGQMFIALTSFDPNSYETLPELATNWQVSQDGTVYTFHLRKDAKWSSGETITAHDVVWAIKRNLAPETKSPNVVTLYIIKNGEAFNKGTLNQSTASSPSPPPHNKKKNEKQEKSASATQPQQPSAPSPSSQLGVRALDDYTVEFTLEHPAAYFPAIVSMWTYRPLPRKVIEQHGDQWTLPEYIQTSGPYTLKEWQKNYRLVLSKNPHYYRAEKVAISEVHYYIVPESTLGLAMYENNELDLIGGQVYLNLPQTDIPRISADPVLRQDLYVGPEFCTEWYGFNVQQPPFDKVLVRKAIAAAIDKQMLIDIVIKGAESPASTFTRPPVFGAVAPEEGIGILFNPTQAKAWLAEAGYPEGKDFPKMTLTFNFSEVRKEVAIAVKTMLKHYLNIDLELQPTDFDRYMAALGDHTTQIFRNGWCSDYPDANNWLYEVFHPTKGYNWIAWKNAEFAKQVELAQRVADPKERQRLYRRAEQILTQEEVAIVPLYFSNSQFLVKPWVKNWFNMAFGGQHIEDWALEN